MKINWGDICMYVGGFLCIILMAELVFMLGAIVLDIIKNGVQ